MEISNKMTDQIGDYDQNWRNYKDGVLGLLSTISDSDYFNVIKTPEAITNDVHALNGTGVMQMNPLRRLQAKEFIMKDNRPGEELENGDWGYSLLAAVEMVAEARVCAGHKQVILVVLGNSPTNKNEIELDSNSIVFCPSYIMNWLNAYSSDVVIHSMALGMNPQFSRGSNGFSEKFFREMSCRTGGIYRRIIFLDPLSMAVLLSYYLREGLPNIPVDGSSAQVHWTDVYEDGQGRGPSIAACIPMRGGRDGTLLRELVGVTCASIKLHEWEQLFNHASEWHSITTKQGMCTPVEVSFNELEFMRGSAGCEAVCDKDHYMACPAEKTSWRWLVLTGLVTSVLAGTFSALYTWKKKKNETEMFRQVDIKSMTPVNDLWVEANFVKKVADVEGAKMTSLVYKHNHQVVPGLSADMTLDNNWATIEEEIRTGSGDEEEDGRGG
jgi:hypothetical protein